MTIDVWLFALDAAPTEVTQFAALLDPDERAQATRLRLAAGRRRYVARHGLLRLLLAGYLDRPAERIAFRCNSFGKPALIDGAGCQFSLSSSGDIGLCAVARGVAIGCDIERRNPRLADRATAQRFFAPAEVAALDGLDEARRIHGFFDCWTRKEAFVKALGAGLMLPLDSFDVTVEANMPPRVERFEGDAAVTDRWTLYNVDAPQGFTGAIAAMTRGDTVRLRYQSLASIMIQDATAPRIMHDVQRML